METGYKEETEKPTTKLAASSSEAVAWYDKT